MASQPLNKSNNDIKSKVNKILFISHKWGTQLYNFGIHPSAITQSQNICA